MEIEQILGASEMSGDTIGKYKMAAQVANTAVATLVPLCVPGADVAQLCALGDKVVHEQLATIFNRGQVEKGPAFPTSISVNECIKNFSPMPEEPQYLQSGDVVKISLGVQVDGYIAMAGHTHIAGASPSAPVTGRHADVICAAHLCGEAVQRMLRPGVKGSAITNVIRRIAAAFKCKPVQGSFTCNLKRFVLEGDKFVDNEPDERLDDGQLEDCEVAANDVFWVNVVLSTGDGKGRDADCRCTVFQRDVSKRYTLKLKAARALYAEVQERFPTMPFALRELEPRNAKLGLTECVKHGLFSTFSVTTEKAGELVAQFGFTALVHEKGTERLSSHALPYIHSVYSVVDQDLQQLLARPAHSAGPIPDALAGTGPEAMEL